MPVLPLTMPCSAAAPDGVAGDATPVPRAARWAGSRPSGWAPKPTSRPSPLYPASGSTGCTSADRRTASFSTWTAPKPGPRRAGGCGLEERSLRLHLLSPLFVSNQFGDLERCRLRPGRASRDNAVSLRLFVLAYNLANFLRSLVLPDQVAQRTLTTMREKLVKISARIVCPRHRYLVFQLAEVAVPRALFAAILHRIERLRGPPIVAAWQERAMGRHPAPEGFLELSKCARDI